MTEPVLAIRNLAVEFRSRDGWLPAVRGIDLDLAPNETLALVGESGSGKSLTALAIMGLVPGPAGRIAAGSSIRFEGEELVGASEKALDAVRGNRIAMIFQEPMTALNPTMTVGAQIAEAIRVHRGLGRDAAWRESERLLDLVKVPSRRRRMHDYPHQFSGGMRQRVMIAIALACRPRVLLADEPTTALDVTIQAQVLGLLEDLKREHGLAVLFITHNLGVVALIADRVAVMYAGEIVESGRVEAIFAAPKHPYTLGLLGSTLRIDRDIEALQPIPGSVPAPGALGRGCAFAPRCPRAVSRCETEPPPLEAVAPGRLVRCWMPA
ncbi:MAG: ABC transporter ATP-binding protein [Rhodospirillales bacterium]|nr:ABC transporter ATP-binding protein [Rhodospirillales bacterium]